MQPGDIVIMRTLHYDIVGPNERDYYVKETLGMVVSLNGDNTVNVYEMKPTHQSYEIDGTGKSERSVRKLNELNFPAYGRRVH